MTNNKQTITDECLELKPLDRIDLLTKGLVKSKYKLQSILQFLKNLQNNYISQIIPNNFEVYKNFKEHDPRRYIHAHINEARYLAGEAVEDAQKYIDWVGLTDEEEKTGILSELKEGDNV